MSQNDEHAKTSVFNHIGISVPDCEAAATWYSSMFGLRTMRSTLHVTREQLPHVPIFKIFGDELQEFKIAWLASGAPEVASGIGLEVFEFIHPKQRKPADGFEFTRCGVFHVAMTVADPIAKRDEVIRAGGRKLGEAVPLPKNNWVAYCQDPWGNALELLPCGFEMMVLNGGGEH